MSGSNMYHFFEVISEKNGNLLSNLFWPTVRKNRSSDWEKLFKFEAEDREFAKVLRPLEHFVQTLCQNNFAGKVSQFWQMKAYIIKKKY